MVYNIFPRFENQNYPGKMVMKIKNRNLKKVNKKFERYNDSEISFVRVYYIRIILQKMPVGLIKDLRNPRGEYVCACSMNDMFVCVE